MSVSDRTDESADSDTHGRDHDLASLDESAPESRPTVHPDQVTIRTLGAFEVYRGTEHCAIPAGLPSQAVKFVVAKGGGVHGEVLIDQLWPEAGLDEGRKGVRNVLNRLGRTLPDLLVRDGDLIRIAPGVSVDSAVFRLAADRVLLHAGAPGAVAGARIALTRYGGAFLPDDHYSEWTAVVREQLRRRHIALIDLVAADARRRGSMLEAVCLLEMAIEVDPVDEIRYLEAAEILLRVGRRGRAIALLQQSRSVLREHGLAPGPAWGRIEQALRDGALPPRPPAAPPPPRLPPRPRRDSGESPGSR